MESDRFRQIGDIFDRARRLENDARTSFLDDACRSDVDLRREVESLLSRHDDARRFSSTSFAELRGGLHSLLFNDPNPFAQPDAPPSHIGQYEVVDEIARGSVGVVYRARDTEIGRDVAIKVLLSAHAGDEDMRRRLREEGRIGGQLQHPSIVAVHEIGSLDERPFIVMKLVEGESFAQQLRRREKDANSFQRSIAVYGQVCQAIAYAHSRGVIHRDLRPDNVLVGAYGEVHVVDWGLARVVTGTGVEPKHDNKSPYSHGRASLTSDGTMSDAFRAPAYLSPEQARGYVDSLDERTDVFGLGALLCEILTGAPPYVGESAREVLAHARDADLGPAFTALDGCGADRELVDLARRCLSAERAERPRTARAVADTVRDHLAGLQRRVQTAEETAKTANAAAKRARRARSWTTALAVLAVLGAIGGAAAYIAVDRAKERQSKELVGASAATEAAEPSGAEAPPKGGGDFETDGAQDAPSATLIPSAEQLSQGDVSDGAAPTSQSPATSATAKASLAQRLEALALQHVAIDDEDVDSQTRAACDAAESHAIATVFAEVFDVDITTLEASVAAERFRVARISADAVTWLDRWASAERATAQGEDNRWRRLVEIAQAVDSDPVRASVRGTLLTGNSSVLHELRIKNGALSESTLLLIADCLAENDEAYAKRDTLRSAQRQHPGSFWVNLSLGESLLHDEPRDPEEAIRFLTAAVALEPRSARARSALAAGFQRSGHHELAAEAYASASRLCPESPALEISLGTCSERLGEFGRAETHYGRAIDLLSASGQKAPAFKAHALLRSGRLQMQRGNTAEAAAQFAESVATQPSPRGFVALGSAHVKRGDTGAAIEAFRRGIELAPSQASAHHGLGEALRAAGDLKGAIAAFQAAIAREPTSAAPHRQLGATYLESGAVDPGLEALLTSIELDPSAPLAYSLLLNLLATRASDLGTMPRRIATRLESVVSQRGDAHALAPQLYLRAWCADPDLRKTRDVLRAAQRAVDANGMRSAEPLVLRARVQYLGGEPASAIISLETALRIDARHREAQALLARYREVIHPDLASFASIDAAFDGFGADADTQLDRARFADFLAQASGPRASTLTRFLEARLAERRGALATALDGFRALVKEDPRAIEAYAGLWRSVSQLHADPARARGEYLKLLRDVELPAEPLPAAALRPVALALIERAAPAGTGVSLESSRFAHLDPRVEASGAHWRLRRQRDLYSLDPVFEAVTSGTQNEVALPSGLLEPNTSYAWQVAHAGADGRLSPFSPEGAFSTGELVYEFVPVDLGSVFNVDVVANPGDNETDALCIDGYALTVDGYDGVRTDAVSVRGLPTSGKVGVHQLAAFDSKNALQIMPQDTSELRIELVEGSYVALRFLVSASGGGATMALSLVFDDGTQLESFIVCPDSFDDVHLDPTRDGGSEGSAVAATPVRNGMDRIALTNEASLRLEERDDAALFEVITPVTGSKALRAVVLNSARGAFATPEARFHLFALTAVRLK